MRPKHIIWDWNGTLLDDRWLSVKAINIVLEKYRLPQLTETDYLDLFTFPVINYYQKLGFDFNATPFTTVGTEFINQYNSRMFLPLLHDGVAETMALLTAQGITQSLLSASKQKPLEELIEFHKLGNHLVQIIGQNDHYAYGKTSAGKAWLKELPYKPAEILFVGDTIHDREVAEEMGVKCVLLACGHTSYERLVSAGEIVIHDFQSLRDWLKSNA